MKKAVAPAKRVVALAKKTGAAAPTHADHSSNYKVSDAVKKLRTIKSREELLEFVKGETRVTITKLIPARLNRL